MKRRGAGFNRKRKDPGLPVRHPPCEPSRPDQTPRAVLGALQHEEGDYAAAFGALQMTPIQIAPGLPDLAAKRAAIEADKKKLDEREER